MEAQTQLRSQLIQELWDRFNIVFHRRPLDYSGTAQSSGLRWNTILNGSTVLGLADCPVSILLNVLGRHHNLQPTPFIQDLYEYPVQQARAPCYWLLHIILVQTLNVWGQLGVIDILQVVIHKIGD